MSSDEPFLKRWARRKGEARERGIEDRGPAVEGDAAATRAPAPADGDEAASGGAAPARKPVLTEEDFADVDFEALDAQSDYARFLAEGVPDSIKYRALQKLWASDPILSQIEPMQEYAGDFTDAAVAVPAGTLKTAYRVGKGFMTDEEVAEWEKLGKPVEEKIAAAPAPVMDADKGVAHDAAGAGDQVEIGQVAEKTADHAAADGADAVADGAEARGDTPSQAVADPTDSPKKAGNGAGEA